MIDSKDKITLQPIFLLLLFTLAFFSQLHMLNRSPYPNGLDGYYYAMEAKSFMERNHLENPSFGPMYYICGLLGKVIGQPIKAVKWGSALLFASMAPAFYLLCRELFKLPICILGALLLGASPSIRLMSINYLNNLLGLLLFLLFITILLRIDKRYTHGNLLLLLLLATGSMLSHLSTGLFTLVILLFFLWDRTVSRLNHGKRLYLHAAIAAAGISLGALLMVTQRGRFTTALQWIPTLPLLSSSLRGRNYLWAAIEMSVLFLSAYTAGILWFLTNRSRRYLSLLVLFFYLPFWNLNSLDMGYRILLCSTPLGVLSLLYLLDRLAEASPLPPVKASPQVKGSLKWALLLLVVPALFISTALYHPESDPPYQYYDRLTQQISLPQDSLLIAHQGLNHVYTYNNDFKDCLNYLPDFPISPDKVWRLAYGVDYNQLERQFPQAAEHGWIQPIDHNYLLIREEMWQRYLEMEEPMIREALQNWYNPHQVRPGFIR